LPLHGVREQHEDGEAGRAEAVIPYVVSGSSQTVTVRLKADTTSTSFRHACAAGCVLLLLATGGPRSFAQDYKPNLPAGHPAIDYERAPATDAASRLAQQLERGALMLDTRPGALSLLRAVLEHLRIPVDSQLLVFSKTSFQAARISPDHPRAIYFNDEVAVGYVPGSSSLEVAAIDPILGPVFYALTVDEAGRPGVARSGTCLRCHQGPHTAGVPGIYVGSVIPGPTGAPVRDESAIITDHTSDFRGRWGGWYVTARRGEQPDRANAVASNPADPETLVRESRQNVTSLTGLFDLSGYPAPTSDIVALMTFEHQTQMANLITRVAWEARIARHAPDPQVETALASDIDDLASYMLFAGEAPLKEPVEGVSSFTRSFPQRGPRDRRGRSLRDFDLQTRLFRYPLSYMVYSGAFDALPAAVRERIYRRLYDRLSGGADARADPRLSPTDRRAIVEILRDTKAGVPTYWFADQ